MDQLYRHTLDRLHHELESTLTPKQRQLLAVGALTKEMCTSQQIAILSRMTPYLEGLTTEQAGRLGAMHTFAEGWEAGQKSGEEHVRKIKIILIIVFLIVVFLVIISN